MHTWDKNRSFPFVITIFSAPNYCDVYGNKAAIMVVKNNMINIQQYNYSPHPFILPDFMNVFSWSIPFVSEKISEMLLQIIKKQDLDLKLTDNKTIEENVTESLRMKVKMITVLMKMYKTLREERELIMKLKGFCPGNKIPRGILIQGPEALKSALERYKKTKKMDECNEMMPKNYK
jgi:serine/threonine-protein phosphatase 2B catalytic subunit